MMGKGGQDPPEVVDGVIKLVAYLDDSEKRGRLDDAVHENRFAGMGFSACQRLAMVAVAVAVDWRGDSRGQARWKAGKISVGNARLLYILMHGMMDADNVQQLQGGFCHRIICYCVN
jgi:hypothetical protein